jgi:pimeloyl-ACP methyl ester carboxylesterase
MSHPDHPHPQDLITDDPVQFVTVGSKDQARQIAIRYHQGEKNCGLVWLGGFKSDMRGTKAEAIAKWAQDHNTSYLRFDYSGHGESKGALDKDAISRWLEESTQIIEKFSAHPQILIGSSMGGWLAILIAQAIQAQKIKCALKAIILIAPAPDFTKDLMWDLFPQMVKDEITKNGFFKIPNDYGAEPYTITKDLIEDGAKNLVLTKMIDLGCPVHIFAGGQDHDVPFTHVEKLMAHLAGDDVTLTLVQDGDHRLSRDQDIALLLQSIETFVAL